LFKNQLPINSVFNYSSKKEALSNLTNILAKLAKH